MDKDRADIIKELTSIIWVATYAIKSITRGDMTSSQDAFVDLTARIDRAAKRLLRFVEGP